MALSREEAIQVLKSHLESESRTKVAGGKLKGQPPQVYQIDRDLETNAVLESIKGVVRFGGEVNDPNTSPPKYAFFVDELPEANWEHPCQYVVVHEDKSISASEETSPPKTDANSALIPVDVKGI